MLSRRTHAVCVAALALVVALLVSAPATVEAKKHRHHSHASNLPSPAHLPSPAQREAQLLQHVQLQTGGAVQDASGKDCLMCTLLLSLMEQYAWAAKLPLATAADQWCSDITADLPILDGNCKVMLQSIVTLAEADFQNRVSPDITCRNTMQKCNGTASQCTLFPTWPPVAHSEAAPRLGVTAEMAGNPRALHAHYAESIGKFLNVHTVSEQLIKTKLTELANAGLLSNEQLKKLAQESLGSEWIPVPIPDWDQDKYASTFTYRGLQWRGKDCNDASADVYPGRNAFQGDKDASADTNCNGISGVDPATQQPYEQLLCEQYPSRGLLAIGDSATAHFSLEPSYVTPANFSATTYADFLHRIESELDWPQCSWSTAYANNTVCPHTKLNISSIYSRMNERNRCNHRDFVNAGVNGASVNGLIQDGDVSPANYSGQMLAYPSRYKVDGPSTVFFAMIGNDICSKAQRYTPVDTFHQKALEEFAYLDTILAPGSHVIIMGLVDGRVLYDTLKGAMHPVGTPYPAFYNYLNCLETSPCFGWMNSNSTIRDESSAHAAQLNEQYQEIMATKQFENFDLHYFWPDYASLISNWTAAGNSALDLIEPVDGFHPSQTGNMLLAQQVWEWMAINVPEAMGLENPNNDRITQLFGDQGGYE